MIELSWRPTPDEAETREVLELVAAATEADRNAPLSEQVLLRIRHGGNGSLDLLARDEHGALVGIAHLDVPEDDPGSAGGVGELVVHPAHRRAGVGTLLVQALLDRATPTGGTLHLWAHGGSPGAAALAARFGFATVRELWRMRRSLLAPLPAAPLPAGVRLRPFVVGVDEDAFLRVNNAAFDWHPEQGGWGLDQVRLREAEPWFDPAGFLLAVDGADRLLGFHWTKVHASDGQDPIGEVYVLGVDPAARGMRLGASLTLAGLEHLRQRGLSTVMLYVEGDNHSAVRLYEDFGFSRWDTDVSYAR